MIRTARVALGAAALALALAPATAAQDVAAQDAPPRAIYLETPPTPTADPFARPPLTVGEPLPDLRLPTIEGETLALSSYRGQKLLLIEFASW